MGGKGTAKKKGTRKSAGKEPSPAEVLHPVAPLPVAEPPAAVRGKRGTQLTPEQVAAILDVLPGSDSVELKVTVPEANQRSTVAALDLDPLDAQIRQVFFFDTPDLALNKAGLVVRARRIQGKGADSVVKLRPVVPQQLSASLRKTPGFVVEVDAMPGGFVCSGTLKGVTAAEDVKRAAAHALPLRKVFTKEQRSLFRQYAPEGIDLDGLSTLGPVFVLKLAFTPRQIGRRLVAEMWLYPDGSRILELSTKCLPAEVLTVLDQARQFLDERGIDRSGDQQAKTQRALAFFAKELKAQAPTGDPA